MDSAHWRATESLLDTLSHPLIKNGFTQTTHKASLESKHLLQHLADSKHHRSTQEYTQGDT
jgi:hypothetical protein